MALSARESSSRNHRLEPGAGRTASTARSQRNHHVPSPRSFASTLPNPSSMPVENIVLSTQPHNNIGPSATLHSSLLDAALSPRADSDDGSVEEEEKVPMFGKIHGGMHVSSLAPIVQISTRQSVARAKANYLKPTDANSMAELEGRLATLPVLRDAIAAEYAGLVPPRPQTSHLPVSHSHLPHAHYPPPSITQSHPLPPSRTNHFTGRSQSFGKNLVARHVGAFANDSLTEAHGTIGALRLELDLLRRINHALANPRTNSSDGVTVVGPYSFSEENFQILFLENQKLREILETNVRRFDETTLALDHKTREEAAVKQALEKAEKDLVALRKSAAQFEQQSVNATYALKKLERSNAHAETACATLQATLAALRAEHEELQIEHRACANFKTLVENEREEVSRMLNIARSDLQAASTERERLSGACASLEGKVLVQADAIAAFRKEVAQLKQERAAGHTERASLQANLSKAKVAHVQSEGEKTTALRQMQAAEEQVAKLSAEMEKMRSENIAETTEHVSAYTLYKEETNHTLALLRAQLADSQGALEALRAQYEAEKQHWLSTHDSTSSSARAASEELNTQRELATKLTAEVERLRQDAFIGMQNRDKLVKAEAVHEELQAEHTKLQEKYAALKAKLQEATSAALAAAASAAADQEDSEVDVNRLASRIRDLEVRLKEQAAAAETARRIHEQCGGKISRAEHAAEREGSLRRVQLKSAKEIRSRLEAHVNTLEVRCQALQKALTQLGDKGSKVIEKLGAKPEFHPPASGGDDDHEVAELKSNLEQEQKAHSKTKLELKFAITKLEALQKGK